MKDLKNLAREKLKKEPQDIGKSNELWNKRAKEFGKMSQESSNDSSIDFFKSHACLKGSSIIDLGSGSGKYLKLLLDEGAWVEGLEPSKAMVEQAQLHLKEAGYGNQEILIHNLAFQEFEPEQTYDYVFISNSPVSSYYENYKRFLKLADKGIFISSWLKRKDPLLEKLAHDLGKEAFDHSSMDLIYVFNLLIADGYFPSFEAVEVKNKKKLKIEDFHRRYTSWLFGPQYSPAQQKQVKKELEKYTNEEGLVPMETLDIKGMLYVDLKKRIL